MKRAILRAAVVLCGLAAAPQAQAEERWFVASVDCEPYESAPLIIVTRRVPNGEFTIAGSTDENFPGGTYYAYDIVVLAPDGGVAATTFAWFQNPDVQRGAYDLTTCTGDFFFDTPPLLPSEGVGFTSVYVSEP